MSIEPFQLERYFAQYEFSARYLLSSSDCESLSMGELLDMADEEMGRMWEGLKFGYTESWGHPLLREQIAGNYQDIDPSGVLTVVPEEGIFLLMHALLQAGDHVICTFPGYQSLYEIARSIGCQVSTWQPEENQDWHFPLDTLAEKLKPTTKLVVVNFPHNPTGYVPTREEYLELIELVRRQGAYLLSDEMYRYLEVNPGTTLPAGCELYERAISLSGLSKSFGLPGLRVGWLVSQDGLFLEQSSKIKDYTTICGSAPSELLAIIALRNKNSILNQQVARVRRNLAILDTFIIGHQEWFRLVPPVGGSVCFPRLLGIVDTSIFCEQLVAETGIMLAPSRVFQYGDHHVRIGFGRENLSLVLERFGNYLDQYTQ